MRGGGALNVLLSVDAAEPVSVARRHKYLSVIMDSDRVLLEKYDAKVKSLKAETEKLEKLRKSKEKSRRVMHAKKSEAERLKRSKGSLLKKVKRQKDRSMKVAIELEAAARELQGLLEELRTERGGYALSGFSRMRGKLPRPVTGSVVAKFGKVRHPRFRTVTFNNGIVIKAPIGKAVRSVYAGKVVFTGWLKGYGQLMIVDNGGGFYTLYAYLDKILKERGDLVTGGMEIGLVGDTGPRDSSGLYFELRERGVPKDPMRWLSKR
jgi:septal ring factor EnvC (AmiA/AmiB activator)